MIWRDAKAPLRYQQFRYQFAAQSISVAGSMLSPVALALGVLQVTGSDTDLGIVLAASSVPTVLMLLFGGVWADRLPRQTIMVVTSITCAVTQIGLGATLVFGHFNLWIAVVLQFVTGVAMAFYFPATTGLTVQTVPSAHLQKANALLSLSRSIAGSVGPLLAGLLVVTLNAGWALVIDGGSFVVCALLLSRLRITRIEPAGARERFSRQLAQGFQEVVRRSWVWTSIVAFMFTHVATAVLFVLGPAVALESEHGVLIWSAVVASLSVGQVIGDVAALRFVPRLPIVASRLVELLVAPLFVALALGAPVAVLIATAVLAGIATTFPDALWYTALQRNLPPNTLSRVSSYDWMGSLALRPAGYLGAAAIALLVGTTTALTVAAVVLVVTRVAGLLFPGVWSLTSATDPPTPEPTSSSTLEQSIRGA